MKTDEKISFKYIFDFDDPRFGKKEFTVYLNGNTLIADSPPQSKESEWTHLDFYKCSTCPLKSSDVKNCPIAFNISGLIELFDEIFSIEKATITVVSKERTYSNYDTAQQGLRGILGIFLATSGCPHMEILKPMVRFHLPFASMQETIFRHVTTYLLSQFFEMIDGNEPDYSMEKMKKKYEEVDLVNQGICQRIGHISESDSSKNALTILNAIGIMMDIELDGKLNSLRYLFGK